MQLRGFDYTRPLYYMVTLCQCKGQPPFSRIVGDPTLHYCEKTPLTLALIKVIRTFHLRWSCIEPITVFSLMPDHLHLLIKIKAVENAKSLLVLVPHLMRLLEQATVAQQGFRTNATHPRLFQAVWHDWILMRRGQLEAFTRYIRENPKRAWLRRSHPQHFHKIDRVCFLGREWHAYGDISLLNAPVIEPFRCSRRWSPEGEEWQGALQRASRLGPGAVGISTFMSPCEKACGNAIYKAGGGFILLSPEGFGERWHPPREKERLCAAGRLLYLSLYPPSSARPDKATLYKRCHEMGEIVAEMATALY